jgi:hypothetical protein
MDLKFEQTIQDMELAVELMFIWLGQMHHSSIQMEYQLQRSNEAPF